MLLPPTAKLSHEVELRFGFFFLLITEGLQLIHSEQKSGLGHSVITQNLQTVALLEICYLLTLVLPTSKRKI